MESIGQYLKRIREERGLSIGEVARLTRIKPDQIEALEEDRLEKFPGEVFARGFVRIYARCLDLDEDETMDRFSQTAQSFFRGKDEDQRQTEQTVVLQNSRRKLQSRFVQVAVVAIMGLAIVIVYNMNAQRSIEKERGSGFIIPTPPPPEAPTVAESPLEETPPAVNKPGPTVLPGAPEGLTTEAAPPPAARKSPTGSTPPATQVPPMPSKPPAAQLPPVVSNPPAAQNPPAPNLPVVSTPPVVSNPPAVSKTPSVQKPPAETVVKPPVEKLPLVVNPPGKPPAPSASSRSSAAAGELVLVIEAVESGWVSARIDGGHTKEVFLHPGQKVVWKAADHFLVSFGNAGGVKIEFNGKDLPPFGPSGAVVKDVRLGRE